MMGRPYDLVSDEEAQRNAMAMWKARQKPASVDDRIKFLEDEVKRLREEPDRQFWANVKPGDMQGF